MAPTVTIAAGAIAATYLFFRFLLHLTQGAREPPAIATGLPFLSPLIGMIKEKASFHVRLRNQYGLPIYTLRLPFSRIYIVNSTELIPLLQKQWRTVSFAAIAADAGSVVGMSKEAVRVMHQDLTSEHSFSVSWPRFITPVMGPGEDLDAINRRSVEVFADEMQTLKAQGIVRLGLSQWSRQTIVTATTESVWGPQNPYRDPVIAKAWKTFEAGFLTFSIFPLASLLFPKLLRARELVAAAMIEYINKGGHKSASGLVRMRYEHHREQFGFSHEDIARGELGNTFAVLGNTTPCAFWVLYHIFSDNKVLSDVRREVLALVHEESKEEGMVCSVDLAGIRTRCPILLSTFQETMRFRAVNPGPRVLLEDVNLDNRYLLKKGAMLMIPAPVQHTDVMAWGDNAGEFDYMRFARKQTPGRKRPNRVAFRAFGGGHILCPGRHFASTEIMAFAALLVLQFDVVPARGTWVEPTWGNSPAQAGFPVPDEDIEVELRPRDLNKKWTVSFSGSAEAMEIVSEDSPSGDVTAR
ncbi:putative Cytochrome P450 [Seiridium unicorne]|uniref:Cytochrome P450 n=1 Tax=Seiridium unicorne TaxID=138068 RepID=A0ABR2VED2_9PEZI